MRALRPTTEHTPAGGEPYRSPSLGTRQEILDLFDKNLAAAREGRTLDLADVVARSLEESMAAERDGATLLIEGVGGLMAPMTQDQTVADWMAARVFSGAHEELPRWASIKVARAVVAANAE